MRKFKRRRLRPSLCRPRTVIVIIPGNRFHEFVDLFFTTPLSEDDYAGMKWIKDTIDTIDGSNPKDVTSKIDHFLIQSINGAKTLEKIMDRIIHDYPDAILQGDSIMIPINPTSKPKG